MGIGLLVRSASIYYATTRTSTTSPLISSDFDQNPSCYYVSSPRSRGPACACASARWSADHGATTTRRDRQPLPRHVSAVFENDESVTLFCVCRELYVHYRRASEYACPYSARSPASCMRPPPRPRLSSIGCRRGRPPASSRRPSISIDRSVPVVDSRESRPLPS
jgi:hypothetical protein